MIILDTSAVQIAAANSFKNSYKANKYGRNVLGVSDEDYYKFIFIGKLCEVVIHDFLISKGISVSAPDLLVPSPGPSKPGADFTLTSSDQEVDVKAAVEPWHRKMLVREDQFRAKSYDVYIGTRFVTDSKIEFHGYATRDDITATAVVDPGFGPCRSLELSELKSPKDFLSMAEAGSSIT